MYLRLYPWAAAAAACWLPLCELPKGRASFELEKAAAAGAALELMSSMSLLVCADSLRADVVSSDEEASERVRWGLRPCADTAAAAPRLELEERAAGAAVGARSVAPMAFGAAVFSSIFLSSLMAAFLLAWAWVDDSDEWQCEVV